MRRRWGWGLLVALLVLAAPASAMGKRAQARQLQEIEQLWASSIRWGDYDTALKLVDPRLRQAHPLTDLELSRYQQVQVSGYSELSSDMEADGTVVRTIELRVINRNTQVERSRRYRERWRWDEQAKQWWNVDGLPDLWDQT
ncbi:MAG: hypothetical protein QM601_10625 [Pseudoxanthomonas sp.]